MTRKPTLAKRRSWLPHLRPRGGGGGGGGASESGQATAEFAFLLPLVVLAALAVIQVGLVVRDQMGVVHAAREAARAASVDADPASAVRAARRTLPGAQVEVASRGGASALGDGRPQIGEEITVRIRYTSVTNLPLVGALFPDPDLHATATMRVEK